MMGKRDEVAVRFFCGVGERILALKILVFRGF